MLRNANDPSRGSQPAHLCTTIREFGGETPHRFDTMPKTQQIIANHTAVSPTEDLVRRLSSIVEREENLKATKENVRQLIFKALKAVGAKNLATIYGSVVLKQKKVYNYAGITAVEEAQRAVEEAKAALAAAQKAAQATAPYEIEETIAFTRNKAVSARAKKGRIYIRSFFRRAPKHSALAK